MNIRDPMPEREREQALAILIKSAEWAFWSRNAKNESREMVEFYRCRSSRLR